MPHSYLALARQLKADIRRQRLAVGERLPSVRALAQAHGLSVDTVQRCHRHLEHGDQRRPEQQRGRAPQAQPPAAVGGRREAPEPEATHVLIVSRTLSPRASPLLLRR